MSQRPTFFAAFLSILVDFSCLHVNEQGNKYTFLGISKKGDNVTLKDGKLAELHDAIDDSACADFQTKQYDEAVKSIGKGKDCDWCNSGLEQ